jgi:hypothetical protein
MSTHQISILGVISPDSTGNCWVEPYDVAATNDIFKHQIIRLKDPSTGQTHGFYSQFWVPNNYVGTAVIIPVWTATATSGNCRMSFAYRAIGGDNAESLDQSSFQETVSNTDAAPGAAHRRMTPNLSLTSGNLAAQDTVMFYFARYHDGGVDTMAADMLLHDLLFQYADA